MIGYGNQTRTQDEVFNLFINKYSDKPITSSTASKVEEKVRTFDNIADNYKNSRRGITENQHLDVSITLQENPHQVTLKQTTCQSSIFKNFKNE